MEMAIDLALLKEPFTFDTDKIDSEVYAYAVRIGMKSILNRGITKAKYDVTGLEGEELDAMREKIVAKAQANLQDAYEGKTRIVGGRSKKKSGVPRAVMSEARKIAKESLKVLFRKHKIKYSQLKTKEFTAAADAYIEQNPDILEQAYAAVEKRETISEVPEFLSEFFAKAKGANAVLSQHEAGDVRKRSARIRA